MAAALMGHHDCVKVLLQYEQKMTDKQQRTALLIAIQGKHWLCVKELMKEKDVPTNDSLLIEACKMEAPVDIIE